MHMFINPLLCKTEVYPSRMGHFANPLSPVAVSCESALTAPGPVVCAALLPTSGGLATLMPAQREPHKHTGSNRGAASLASFILES